MPKKPKLSKTLKTIKTLQSLPVDKHKKSRKRKKPCRLSPDPKEASGSTTYSIRSDPNFVDDEDGWMREFLPKENEDDIDEIELEEIQDSISEFNSTSNSTRAHEELTDLLPLEPSGKEAPKLKDEPEDQEDEGQNHKKGSEKKKNEENKDDGAKSSVGKLPENRGPRRETYKQKIIDTIIQSEMGCLTLQRIYEAMEKRYPDDCGKDNKTKWQNSIRHNLSLHKNQFKRIQIRQPPNACWCVITDYNPVSPETSELSVKKELTGEYSSVSSLRGRPPKGEKGDRHRHHRKKSKRDSIIRVQVDLTDDIFEKHKDKRNELFICSKQMYDAIQRYYKLQQLEIITLNNYRRDPTVKKRKSRKDDKRISVEKDN